MADVPKAAERLRLDGDRPAAPAGAADRHRRVAIHRAADLATARADQLDLLLDCHASDGTWTSGRTPVPEGILLRGELSSAKRVRSGVPQRGHRVLAEA